MNSFDSYSSHFFESFPNPERHIDRLYVAARLAGLTPKIPSASRVLEIGCSTGINLIPQAQLYPESSFTGIDPSAMQIEQGRGVIRALRMHNLTLEISDIESFSDTSTKFDYIICHGLFSWVPDSVREQILQGISRLIAPDGVAYLSFNSPSGWHRREGVRQMVLEFDRLTAPLGERVFKVRETLKMLSGWTGHLPGSFGETVSAEIRRTLSQSDSILAHEYLNRFCEPFSMTAVLRRAGAYGLSSLGDPRLRRSVRRFLLDLPPGALRRQLESAEFGEREDMFDLIEPKTFRAVLLTGASLSAHAAFQGMHAGDFRISSALVPVSIGHHGVGETFMSGQEEVIEVSDEQLATLLKALHASWPQPQQCSRFFDVFPEGAAGSELERLIWTQHVELSFGDFACAAGVGEFPRVSAYARYQAERGGIVTSLRHEHCELNAFERLLVSRLDGSRTHQQLADEMLYAIVSGQLQVSPGSGFKADRVSVGELTGHVLAELAERGMFETVESA